MAEGAEVEDRVDFDEENYMEEMDDDVEEQIDEDGDGGGDDENGEENAEEVHEDSMTGASGKDHSSDSPDAEGSHIDPESAEEDEKAAASVDEDEKEKHAQLLALPPHGSEVFIGGIPRDVSEEDLGDLCDAIGDILEV